MRINAYNSETGESGYAGPLPPFPRQTLLSSYPCQSSPERVEFFGHCWKEMDDYLSVLFSLLQRVQLWCVAESNRVQIVPVQQGLEISCLFGVWIISIAIVYKRWPVRIFCVKGNTKS